MRIEKLNNDKIKVTLTTADLMRLDIDVNQLAPDSKELHTFLFHIMETIREETGFNPYSGQVVVEATPSRDGISIMVSRLAVGDRKISRAEFTAATAVKAKIKKKTKRRIFYFDNFDDMCAALVETDSDCLEKSRLYSLDEMFCLIISDEASLERDMNILSEFCCEKSSDPIRAEYIKEHGALIAEKDKLINMAEELRNIL